MLHTALVRPYVEKTELHALMELGDQNQQDAQLLSRLRKKRAMAHLERELSRVERKIQRLMMRAVFLEHDGGAVSPTVHRPGEGSPGPGQVNHQS